MSTNTFVSENSTNNNPTGTSVISNNGPIAHLGHMLNSLPNDSHSHSPGRMTSLDPYDNKPLRIHSNHRSTPRANITDGKIVECSSDNTIVYRYYTGEATSIIDEHFDKALKQPNLFHSTRAIPPRDSRTSSYGYPSMVSSSSSFWPNFMTSSTSYPHPTYLPTSQNDYSDWMHHHSSYRSPYSSNPPPGPSPSSSTTPSAVTSSMSNSHLHPLGSPTAATTSNPSRYHHAGPEMDMVTAAAIGAAAAAQMFHHEKQSHHSYTPTSHFDYHLGGSMMASASYGFPTQSFDLMGSTSSTMALDNSTMKEATTSSPWYSNHHLSC